MKTPPRLWLFAGIALAALVAIVAVLNAISRLIWDLQSLLPYWLAGPVALLLVGGGALVIVRLAWPGIRDLGRKPIDQAGSQAAIEPPGNRQEAAQQNLAAIDQLLERIRDDVQRQALQQERLRVEAQLQRGDLLFIGYEPQRHWVIGIWLGNDDNRPTGSSSALAAGLWSEIVRAAGNGSLGAGARTAASTRP